MEYQKRISLLLLLKIFLVGVVSSQKNTINLNDGAYSNLLIAIHKDVPEDLNIIENLKTMFTSASQRLYLATKQHVYWKHIKILVPNTWSNQSQYQFASTENSQSANILVHSHLDDEPFVENVVGCGNEGSLMHLTPAYILDMQYREDKFGNTSSVLVRNWGYYRWGLFKEHYDGDEGTAPTYDITGGGTEGTRCSLKIKGNLALPGSNTCPSSPSNGYDPDCRFVPETVGQTATASLLFATRLDAHIHSIEEFCGDDASVPDSLHNRLAPNLMNKLCNYRSAWSVMTNHTDFQAVVPPVSNTTPVFEVLQLSSVRSVVLVLDISNSMLRNRRFERMIQSSTVYIMNVIPSGSKLGIVVFDSTSQTKAGLTDITDTASRQGLVDALPLSPGDSTCIGCGIVSGIKVLGSYAQGGYMLLLSDGVENKTPYIKDIYDDINKSGVIFDTITISNAADQQMEDLSNNTSGKSSFCSDTGIGPCLIYAFQSTITERPCVGMEAVPIQIFSSEVIIEPDPGFYIIPVIIDAALGNETVITVVFTNTYTLPVVVTGPDSTRVDHGDPRYHDDLEHNIVSIKLPLAQAGLWNITFNDVQRIEYVSVSVTSKPTTQEYSPVVVTVLLGSYEVNFNQTPALAIYAQVQQDYLPVLNADVTAIVSDSSNTISMTLLDNGSGSDLLKDDGTYSGFFLSFTSNDRYNVKVNVVGYDVVVNRRGKRSAELEVETAVEPSFMRTASGGVFKVQGYTPNSADILPPSRIQDLVYTSFSYDNSTVTLSWTAVGDDLDQGTAYNYELRYSTNFNEVRNYFSNSHEVTQDQLVNGNLSYISPAGVIETVTISFPERGKEIVYYFAIRAWDEVGNAGDLSNIASLSIRDIPVSVPTIKPTGPPKLALIIIGVCCAVGVVFIVGVVMTYICYRKRHVARSQEGLQEAETTHKNPTYDNPTFSTN